MDKEEMMPTDDSKEEKEIYLNLIKKDLENTLDLTKIIEEINNEY